MSILESVCNAEATITPGPVVTAPGSCAAMPGPISFGGGCVSNTGVEQRDVGEDFRINNTPGSAPDYTGLQDYRCETTGWRIVGTQCNPIITGGTTNPVVPAVCGAIPGPISFGSGCVSATGVEQRNVGQDFRINNSVGSAPNYTGFQDYICEAAGWRASGTACNPIATTVIVPAVEPGPLVGGNPPATGCAAQSVSWQEPIQYGVGRDRNTIISYQGTCTANVSTLAVGESIRVQYNQALQSGNPAGSGDVGAVTVSCQANGTIVLSDNMCAYNDMSGQGG